MSAHIDNTPATATTLALPMETGVVRQESTKAHPRDLNKIRAELAKRAEIEAARRRRADFEALIEPVPESVIDVDCPQCLACAGNRCVTTSGGRSRQFHASRQKAFNSVSAQF